MKIAVTYEDGQVYQHFGHTQEMKIYTLEDGKITGAQVISTEGSGHSALAGFLTDRDVDCLICGGIGYGARQALEEAGIKLYAGVTGAADDAVEALLTGGLQYSEDATCDHHGEGHGHGEGHHCHHHGGDHGEGHHCHHGECGHSKG